MQYLTSLYMPTFQEKENCASVTTVIGTCKPKITMTLSNLLTGSPSIRLSLEKTC